MCAVVARELSVLLVCGMRELGLGTLPGVAACMAGNGVWE